MAERRSCRSCWFAGMDVVGSDPHGPLKNTCTVTPDRKRIKGGCGRWAIDQDRGPTHAELQAARRG